jgi:serine/threonine-protein kinase
VQTARLTSPHTVSIYDFGRTPDGLFYYVMEYLDGIDLEDLVKQSGPVAPGRAVRVLRQVCAALTEAHGIGLIHRDIKPANILLCERGGFPDIAKVLISVRARGRGVFGSALTGRHHSRTPQYLAPRPGRPTRSMRAATLRLGAVGYFLLTGTRCSPARARSSTSTTTPDRARVALEAAGPPIRPARGRHPVVSRERSRPPPGEREGSAEAQEMRRRDSPGRLDAQRATGGGAMRRNAAKTA